MFRSRSVIEFDSYSSENVCDEEYCEQNNDTKQVNRKLFYSGLLVDLINKIQLNLPS